MTLQKETLRAPEVAKPKQHKKIFDLEVESYRIYCILADPKPTADCPVTQVGLC
jgi:hypothetical protein